MLELIPVIITITGAIIGVSVGVRTLLKGPHVTFSLDRAKITFYNEANEEKVLLLFALVENKKKIFFGDSAKKVTACVIYRAPIDDDKIGLNASAGLPWLESCGARIKILGKLESQEDILNALERYIFERKETDLPQGRGRGLTVAYGIEHGNKLFLASNPPIEIPLPSPNRPQEKFTGCFLRLEIAGENLPSTLSEGTVIFGNSWNNWTVPSKVEAIMTPNMLRNILLRLGIGRKQKVIECRTRKD